MGASKLRLVHVLVQPVFMLDDGETLKPIGHPAVTIPADEWPTYSGERFPREIQNWQKQIDAEHASATPESAADRGKEQGAGNR